MLFQISPIKGLVTLKNNNDKELREKYNKVRLNFLFFFFFLRFGWYQRTSSFSGDEINQNGDDCIENAINDVIQNDQPLDKTPVESSQNSQIPDEAPAINGWDKLPDEILEKILIKAIKSSDHVCETYSNIINSCSRFQIIGKKGEMLFPCIYIKPDDDIKKLFNGKIKVSVRKLLKSFGQGSRLIVRVVELIGDKNLKSAWFILFRDRNRGIPFRESTGEKHSRKVKNPQLAIA